jgi:hypothetical protein
MREALERAVSNNQRRQLRLDQMRKRASGNEIASGLADILGSFRQRDIDRETERLQPQLQDLDRRRRTELANAIASAGGQTVNPANLPLETLQKIRTEQLNRGKPDRRIIKDIQGFQRDVDTGERLFPDVTEAQKSPKDRGKAKDRFGTLRFLDTGDPVFPAVKGQKGMEERKQEALAELPRIEANAIQSISLIDKLLEHPGLETSVGAKGASLAFGAFSEPVAGTDAADFYALFNQIKGKQFLEAFEQLKGAGQITEVEGIKATQAVSRMDLAQSEKEFIDAAKEFQGIIKKGLRGARKAAGLEGKKSEGVDFVFNPETGELE